MRPIINTVSMAAADDDSISTSQTPAAGGAQNLTITGALAAGGVATMDTPRHVVITCAGSDAARSFVVTGTDRYGTAMTETLAGSAGSTTAGAKNFKTITQVQVDANTAGAVKVGTNNACEGGWVVLDRPFDRPFNVGVQCSMVNSGACTYALQQTLQSVQVTGFSENDAVTSNAFSGKTAAYDHNQTVPATAIRLAITSHTAGGVKAVILQA